MSAAERKSRIAAAKAELQELKEELQKMRGSRAVDSLHSTAIKVGVSADRVPKLAERKRLYGHYGKVYAMAWAGDSEQVVSARYVSHATGLSRSWPRSRDALSTRHSALEVDLQSRRKAHVVECATGSQNCRYVILQNAAVTAVS